jgi:hypothetical protein
MVWHNIEPRGMNHINFVKVNKAKLHAKYLSSTHFSLTIKLKFVFLSSNPRSEAHHLIISNISVKKI